MNRLRQTAMSASTEHDMKALRRKTSTLARQRPAESLLARFEAMFAQMDPATEMAVVQRVRRALFGDIIDSIRPDAEKPQDINHR